jgi:predicted Zn-dependent protease
MLAVIAAAAGRWDRALTAANEWRNRSLDRPLPADLRIAEFKLHLNDPTGAIQQLTPYLDRARQSPDTMPDVFSLYSRAMAQQGDVPAAQAALAPLLSQSSAWRRVWLEIGTSTAPDTATAANWIDRVAPAMDLKLPAEQLRLALAWYNVAKRLNDDAALTKARDLLKPLADGPAAIAGAQLLYGSVAQLLNDLPTAESAYRAALPKADASDLPMLRNNLAYTILLRDGDLTEARKLAESAIADAPANSAYQDTLARIYARQGDTAAAVSAFESAIRADATNLEALIGLADTQAKSGQRSNAELTLARIDTLLRGHRDNSSNAALPEPVRRQLDDVRAALKKPATDSPSAAAK